MDRSWLLTWTTYGTWLPGDSRGFVSNVRGEGGGGVRHNTPGTPCDADLPGLRRFARASLKGRPIYLTPEQAVVLLRQFQETAAYRGWTLLAAAIMSNHTHLVVAVPADPDPSELLGAFKSYGSRTLNALWGKPPGETWWTESGSKRKLLGESAVQAAVRYVQRQARPLLVWTAEGYDSGGGSPSGERGA